jgi:NAD(P)-dependent dehydrogenase (short-subunit alcohol dehydrogenase family)
MSSKAPGSAAQFLAGLDGQRVLITAGASGIGFAIASTLSALGARPLICDISEEAIGQAKRALP